MKIRNKKIIAFVAVWLIFLQLVIPTYSAYAATSNAWIPDTVDEAIRLINTGPGHVAAAGAVIGTALACAEIVLGVTAVTGMGVLAVYIYDTWLNRQEGKALDITMPATSPGPETTGNYHWGTQSGTKVKAGHVGWAGRVGCPGGGGWTGFITDWTPSGSQIVVGGYWVDIASACGLPLLSERQYWVYYVNGPSATATVEEPGDQWVGPEAVTEGERAATQYALDKLEAARNKIDTVADPYGLGVDPLAGTQVKNTIDQAIQYLKHGVSVTTTETTTYTGAPMPDVYTGPSPDPVTVDTSKDVAVGGQPVSNSNPLPSSPVVNDAPVSNSNPLPSAPTVNGAPVSDSNPLPSAPTVNGAPVNNSNPLPSAPTVNGAPVSNSNPLPVHDSANDNITVPDVPGTPEFDTTFDVPEELSIPERITSFISSNPIVAAINGSHIELSGAVCRVQGVVLFGKQTYLDWCWMQPYLQQFGVLIVLFAGLSAAFIIFRRDA